MKNFMARIRDFIKCQIFLQKTLFSVAPILALFCYSSQVISAIIPILMSIVYRHVIDGLEVVFLYNNLETRFLAVIGLYVLSLFIVQIYGRWASLFTGFLNGKIQKRLSAQLNKRLANSKMEFFDNPDNQNMISKIYLFRNTAATCMNSGIMILAKVISLLCICVLFIQYNPLVGIIYTFTTIPGAIMHYNFTKKMNQFSIDSIPETRRKDYYREVLTSGVYAKEVRLYNNEDFFRNKFISSWNSIREKRSSIFRIESIKVMFSSFIGCLGYVALVFISGYNVFLGIETLGIFSMYTSLAQNVNSIITEQSITIPAFLNFYAPQILEYKHFIEGENNCEKDKGKYSVPSNPNIEFKNVYFKYPGTNNWVLNDLSFCINSGEKVALVGVNGAGKTTIIKLLLRFYEPDSGEITLNGINIQQISLTSLRNMFGVYFQDSNNYSMTLRENIILSNLSRKYDDNYINAIAEKTGISSIYETLPHGLDTNLTRLFDDNGYEPSGGQWQKIAITRTFAKEADFLILDEPFSALDPNAEHDIYMLFKELCKEKGGIIVSHRLIYLNLVDKVIMIESGHLVECGPQEELLRKGGKYASFYNLQANMYREEDAL